MNARLKEQYQLDSLLLGLENEILKLDDAEILSEEANLFAHIEDIRALVNSNVRVYLDIEDSSSTLPTEDMSSDFEQKQLESLVVPNNPKERRKLLETLVSSQTNMPLQFRMAFSAKNEPTEPEVDAMIARLIRLGILKNDDTDE
ncbi:MAG: hypothetical protein OXE44_08275 [Nitrospinae bacterium]|nr:hypothetical protein [Nitrospinota bacterium]